MTMTGPSRDGRSGGEHDTSQGATPSPNGLGVLRFMIFTGRIDHAATRAERARIVDNLTYADFPGVWGSVFDVCAKLHRAHNIYTEAEIATALTVIGVEHANALINEVEQGPVSDDRVVQRYTDGLLQERMMRQVRDVVTRAASAISEADQGRSPIRDPGEFGTDIADRIRSVIDASPTDGRIEGFYEQMDQLLDHGHSRYVLNRFLRIGEVIVVTAGGGLGKSDLGRTLAFAAENGLDPFTGAPHQPSGDVRSLVIDLETQEQNIIESTNRLLNKCGYLLACRTDDVHQPALYSRRGRMDIRDRATRTQLREMLRRVRPGFVAIGPLKNIFIEGDRESYSAAALETQDILMNLMSDFEFALYLEAHGSKGMKTATAGSQRWEDWPDMAIGLELVDEIPKTGKETWIKTIAQALDDRKGTDMLLRVTRNREPRNSHMDLPMLLMRSSTRYWTFSKVSMVP